MNISIRRALLSPRTLPFSLAKPLRTYRQTLNHVPVVRSPIRRNHQNHHFDPKEEYSRQQQLQIMSCKVFIWTMIGANTVVFAGWNYSKWLSVPLRDRQRMAGKWWTTLTAGFSHQDFIHYGFNMYTLYQMSQLLIATPGVGPTTLAALYLGGIVAGNVAFMYHRQTSGDRVAIGLGASGGVESILVACACLAPKMKMLIFGIIPLPAWAAALGFAAIDAGMLQAPINSFIGHDAHLGGAAFGVLFYVLRLRRYRPHWKRMGF